jgi:hypothetical protein
MEADNHGRQRSASARSTPRSERLWPGETLVPSAYRQRNRGLRAASRSTFADLCKDGRAIVRIVIVEGFQDPVRPTFTYGAGPTLA